MILDFVAVADAANIADGKLYLHGGCVTRFNVPQFPFFVPVAIVARLIHEPADEDRERTIQIQWRHDGEAVTPPIEGPIRSPRPAPPLAPVEGEETSGIIVATFNPLPLPSPGIYELLVMLDGDVISRKTLPAVLVEAT
jgi:Family of unknown function (DUF6941)